MGAGIETPDSTGLGTHDQDRRRLSADLADGETQRDHRGIQPGLRLGLPAVRLRPAQPVQAAQAGTGRHPALALQFGDVQGAGRHRQRLAWPVRSQGGCRVGGEFQPIGIQPDPRAVGPDQTEVQAGIGRWRQRDHRQTLQSGLAGRHDQRMHVVGRPARRPDQDHRLASGDRHRRSICPLVQAANPGPGQGPGLGRGRRAVAGRFDRPKR